MVMPLGFANRLGVYKNPSALEVSCPAKLVFKEYEEPNSEDSKRMYWALIVVEAESDVQVSVMDASGRVAVQQNRVMSKGNNQVQVDLARLGSGIYFVQVRNGDMVSTRKLVVQQ